jgi:endonuclease-3
MALNAEKRFEIFRRLAIAIPEPKTELHHNSVFELLIAVILSAQATDKGVNIATAKLYPVANTPSAILALGVEGLERYIKTIGLYHSKAKNVIATCKILVERFDSIVPNTREALESLPGVGRKTANVITSVIDQQPNMAVDTHVYRVSRRIGLVPMTATTPLAVEKELIKHIPTHQVHTAHHWLILHGRYTCLARSPKCGSCGILAFCKEGTKNKKASSE